MPAKTQRKKRPANFPDPQIRLAAVSSKQRLVESAPGPVVDQAARVTTDKKLILTLCILLVATTLAIYYRATSNPFVNYDDWGYVTENHHVQQGLSRDTLRWALTATEADNWHPLTWMSHALDCQLFGLNAAGHHLTSVFLHLCNVALLFLMLRRVTGAKWRSLMVAALFALHPINVESVAWVAERKNVLSMLFFLLTLGAYGWYARRRGATRYIVTCILFALGLTAKPMIVTLPCVLLLLDFWPLGRVEAWSSPSPAFQVEQYRFSWLLWEKLPLFLLSAGSSAITIIAQRGAIRTTESYPVLIRLANSIYAYVLYFGKTFWPLHLGSFYPYEGPRLAPWQILFSLALLGGVTVWAWRSRSRRYLPVGWFWFLGTMVPMIGLVQVGDQAMADRYAYLPLIGLFSMIAWGAGDWVDSRRGNVRWVAVAAAVVLAALSALTWRQISIWDSSYDLWSHALAVTKNNYMAEDYVGTALLVKAYEENGQRYSDEALVHFQNAARINPRDAVSHLNLGADYQEHGKTKEAIEQYNTVMQITRDPRLLVKVYIDLGAAFHQLGDLRTSRRFYQEALDLDPHNRVAFENLGKLGMDQRLQQLAAEATAHPSAKTYLQLGQLQQATGRLAEARSSYRAALNFDHDATEARGALKSLDSQQRH